MIISWVGGESSVKAGRKCIPNLWRVLATDRETKVVKLNPRLWLETSVMI